MCKIIVHVAANGRRLELAKRREESLCQSNFNFRFHFRKFYALPFYRTLNARFVYVN